MRRYMIFAVLLAMTTGLQAQGINKQGLKDFIQEISNVKGTLNKKEQRKNNVEVFMLKSGDDMCYEQISAIINKHDIYFAEEFLGMSLYICVREDCSQIMLFYTDEYALVIVDDNSVPEIDIAVTKGLELNQVLRLESFEDMGVEVANSGDVAVEACEVVSINSDFEVEPLLPKEVIMALFNHYQPQIDSLKNEKLNVSDERVEVINKEIAAIKKQWNEEIELLRKKIDELAGVSFVYIPCIDESYLVAPMLSKEEMSVEPQAREGIMDWINGTGFYKGYNKGGVGNNGQRSCIVRPCDVVLEYVRKYSTKMSWNCYGYSPALEAIFKNEIQGGEPLYLYRVSDTEEGYNIMVKDLEQLLCRKVGGKYMGMKVTNRIEKDGMRFVQYYSKAGVVLVFDSPADKLCRMDVIIGGGGAFENAVNDYTIDGVTGVAQKCNIVINLDEIKIIDGLYERNGVSFDCGVHFDAGYWEKLIRN